MKKLLIIFLLTLLFYPTYIKADDLVPSAKNVALIDYNTGDILYSKNENAKTAVASLTKMMGLIIIFEKLETGALKLDEILTTSKTAKEMGGSQIWLEEGEKISVNDLIKGITMASANDAMVLMAERISGTEEEFVKLMNEKAKSLGLKNTNFVNSTGLDEEGGFSSAYDIALVAKELLKHKKILEYTSKYEDYIREKTDNKTWLVNSNKLLKFYDGVDGLKTGYTDNAGSSLCITASRNNLRLIAVTIGFPDAKTRNSETMKLLDYGFNIYESKILIPKGKEIDKISINKANIDKISLILKDDLKVTLKKGDNNLDYKYSVKLNDFKYPVKKGDIIGQINVLKDNVIVAKEDLITSADILKASFFKQYLRTILDMFTGFIIK